MSSTALAVINCVGLAVVLCCNAIVGPRIGRVSRKYDTAFTPASFAFAIWTPIYALLIATVVGQFYDETVASRLSGWFLAQCVLTVAWLFLFTRKWLISASVSLILLCVAVGFCYGRIQTWKTITRHSWPRVVASVTFSIYFGWTLLASILGVCVASRTSPLLPTWLKATVWTLLLVAVLIVQVSVLDPLLSLPLAWGAFMRAQRNDTVAYPFASGFVMVFVGVQIASILHNR